MRDKEACPAAVHGVTEFDMARLTGQQQQLPFNSFSHKTGALVKSSLAYKRAFGFRLSQADRIR